MHALILSAIFGLLFFLLYMVVAQIMVRKETRQERVHRVAGSFVGTKDENTEADVNALYAEQDPSPLAAVIEKLLNLVINTEAFRKKSQLLFYRAGVGSPDAPIYYLLFKYVLPVVWLLLAAWLVFFAPAAGGLDQTMNVIEGLMLVILALAGPDLYLQNLRKKREKKLNRSFPDTMDLLLACVESGLALDGALARVCKELAHAYPEVTQELNRTRGELTLLNDRPQALINLAERVDLHSYRLLVNTLLQSERFGTSLAETLRVLTDDSRNTQLMKAEELAGRLPALMTIPLVLLLLPALFIIILGPAIITAKSTFGSVMGGGGQEEKALR